MIVWLITLICLSSVIWVPLWPQAPLHHHLRTTTTIILLMHTSTSQLKTPSMNPRLMRRLPTLAMWRPISALPTSSKSFQHGSRPPCGPLTFATILIVYVLKFWHRPYLPNTENPLMGKTMLCPLSFNCVFFLLPFTCPWSIMLCYWWLSSISQ